MKNFLLLAATTSASTICSNYSNPPKNIILVNKRTIFASLFAAFFAAASAQSEVTVADSIADRELDVVSVVAQKPLVKMDADKMSYAVNQDADAKSATILDMLRKVPMVTVDGQDNITINGSSAFKVYLDGKPNVMFSANPSQVFKSMPASIVKKIEVITNPGAKYDAEGVGGILNIVLDREVFTGGGPANAGINGINGNVRLEGGNRGGGGAFYLSGQRNKFTFTANFNTNQMVLKGTEVDMIQEQFGLLPSKSIIHQQNGDTYHPFYMGNLGLGYEIDDRSTVNVSVDYSAFQMRNDGLLSTEMTGPLYGPGFSFDMHNTMRMGRQGVNASADYQRFLNADRTSNIAITYQFSRNPSLTRNRSEYEHAFVLPDEYAAFLQDRYSDNNERSTENTLQVDYTTPIAGEDHKLNAGAKFTSHRSLTESDYFFGREPNLVLQDELCSAYDNMKSILAGYGEYEGKFGDFGSRAGLRYEHTFQSVEFTKGNGGNYDNNYGNLIPSLSFSYSPIAVANIGLNYNMRISRPGISFLNPYVDRSINTAITYGNPDLDVETSHNVGFVANFFTPKIMFSFNARYAYTGNAIEKYSFYKDNLLHNTYGNIVKRQLTSLSLFASYLLHKNTRLFTNCGLTYNDVSSEKLAAQNSGWQYNIMFGVQQTFPRDFKGGLFLIANSKTFTLQGHNTGFNMITANVSRAFFKDKFDVSLRGMTTLHADGKVHFNNYAEGPDFASTTNIASPLWGFSLSLSYKFGNSKVNVRQHKSKVKSDIMENTNQMQQLSQPGGQGGMDGMKDLMK